MCTGGGGEANVEKFIQLSGCLFITFMLIHCEQRGKTRKHLNLLVVEIIIM